MCDGIYTCAHALRQGEVFLPEIEHLRFPVQILGEMYTNVNM